jgi:peptidoglycan/xylan/chitin deacetylase (PgdA/CDA1 family)
MSELTLTFDNGPHAEATPLVLDILSRHDVKTTFFVVGERLAAPQMRGLVERAHDEGHWIGNHTWSHATPLGQQPDQQVATCEIDRTQALIGELSHPNRLFRPFGGGGRLGPHLLSPHTVDVLKAGGYTCVLWNAVPRDWADPDDWIDTALAQCAAIPSPLMVLHDVGSGAMAHLDRFLGLVRDRGMSIRQDFPAECVPISRGQVVSSLATYSA